MRRPFKILVTFAFAAWLATPLVLIALGAGSGFAALERRRPARLPELSAAAIFDSGLYSGLADYFADRVPLRTKAVAADSWIDLHLFGDSPSAKVVLGAGGWLFSRESMMAACGDQPSPSKVVATIGKIDRVLRASGRRFIFLVAPNKEAVYPRYLGPAVSLVGCSRAFRRELRSRLRQAELADFIDLWQALESLKGRTDREIYYPHDTHWTPDAALEVTRRIVERLDPALWDESRVVTNFAGRHRGDLSNMIALPTWDPSPTHKVERMVKVKIIERGRFRRLAASGEVFSKRVLVIDDSFGRTYRDNLSRFLGDSTWIHSGGIVSAKDRDVMMGQFARAEVVVLEVVERSLADLAGNSWQDLPVRLAGELLADLPAAELDLGLAVSEAEASRVLFDLPAAAAGAARYLVVDLELSDRRPGVVARHSGRRWRNVRSVELSKQAGGRRIGAEIPPGVTVVAIRWGAVRAAWLVDLPIQALP